MAKKTEENNRPAFQVLFGDAQTFINQYVQLRNTHKILQQFISTTVVQVTQQDYAAMAEQLKGSPELIAQIAKPQTVVMISGFFEVEELPKKIIQP